MKTSGLIFIYLSLIGLAVCASADERPKQSSAAIPPIIHARIIQLEDERNLNGDELTGLLKHRTPEVRERAALAIGRIGDKRGAPALIDAFDVEKDLESRVAVAFALGEIGDLAAVPILLKAFTIDREVAAPLLRARGCEALGKILSARLDPQLDQRENTVVRTEGISDVIARQLPAPESRLADDEKLLAGLAITALMRLRSAFSVEPLARQLKSNDAELRALAANALARLRQPIGAAVPALIDALNDGGADVRANAARALGVSKDSRAVEPLLKALHDESEHAQVNAARALAAIGDRRAVEPLIELAKLSDPKTTLQRRHPISFNLLLECVVALGTLKDERALQLLGELSRTFAPTAIQEVEVAIAKFGVLKTLPPSFRGGKSWVGRECSNWKNAVIAAQVVGAQAQTGDDGAGEKARALLGLVIQRLNLPKCDPRGWPEVVRAMSKTGNHWPALLLRKLESGDVIVRSAVATFLAEDHKEEFLTPLISALKRGKSDSVNDAKLAILTALSKYKSEKAIEAIKSALDDQDHLVRRRAIDLLKQIGAGDFSDRVGTVQTGHNKLFYRRVAARLNKKVTATIYTGKGQIKIELFPQDAPITVDSFITLARKGFFNNLTFHRVVPNFVIQGGDPRGDGEGGPGYQIRCEINTRPYTRGAIGMALSGKDTGGSQFFITHSPQPHLDGGYTVFGQVTSGMAAVDRIARGDSIRKVEIFESR